MTFKVRFYPQSNDFNSKCDESKILPKLIKEIEDNNAILKHNILQKLSGFYPSLE